MLRLALYFLQFWYSSCYCGWIDGRYLPSPAGVAGKTWALLVAGSKGWADYRHQADICHAYQLLKRNGIPDENIVVMATDDIAYHENNPTPGVVINRPGGPDVYRGVTMDYNGSDVNSMNFLNILSGNKTAMVGIGSGKVINSGPDDVIFLNFVGHGSQGILMFPNDELFADDFLNKAKDMRKKNKFSKMVMYIEACFAGSLFDNMLSDYKNIFVITAADSNEPSSACYKDDERNTWLSNVFSALWMSHTEHESSPGDSLHHQYERVRSFTNTSHPQEYGDLDVGVTKLRNVLGPRKRTSEVKMYVPPFLTDIANNMDIPLLIILNQKNSATDPQKKKELKREHHKLIKGRESIDDLFKHIMERVSDSIIPKQEELRTSKSVLTHGNFKCYKELYNTFSNSCLSPVQNPYSSLHLQKLVNMCAVNWLSQEKAQNDIITVCRESFGPKKPEHVL